MNQPAFPVNPDVLINDDTLWQGMTLRDYFAAKALAAFIDPNAWQSTVGEISRHVAFNAYALADAMLEARKT
jgi:hypothetical protein